MIPLTKRGKEKSLDMVFLKKQSLLNAETPVHKGKEFGQDIVESCLQKHIEVEWDEIVNIAYPPIISFQIATAIGLQFSYVWKRWIYTYFSKPITTQIVIFREISLPCYQ